MSVNHQYNVLTVSKNGDYLLSKTMVAQVLRKLLYMVRILPTNKKKYRINTDRNEGKGLNLLLFVFCG